MLRHYNSKCYRQWEKLMREITKVINGTLEMPRKKWEYVSIVVQHARTSSIKEYLMIFQECKGVVLLGDKHAL